MHKILDALVCGRCRNTNQGSNRSGAAQARNDGRQLADQTVALEALGSSDSDKNRKTLNRDSGTGPAVSDPQADHRQLDPRSQQHPQQPGIESSRAGPKTPVPRFNPPMSSVLAPVFNEASPPPKRPKSRDRPDKIPTTADNPSTGRSAPDPAIVKGPIEGESGKGLGTQPITSYLTGGVKISLTTLQAVAALVPIPWIQTAVGAALQVISVAELVSSNSSSSKALQHRAYSLMLVLATPLEGKTEEELEKGSLKKNIGRLASDLYDIVDELRVIRADSNFRRLSSLPKAVLTSSDIEGRIAECSAKLEWAMKVFQVESQIGSRLDDLQRHEDLLDTMRKIEAQMRPITRATQANLLEQNLRPADAAYNSHARKAASTCLEGTRVDLLRHIFDWMYSNAEQQLRMFYLYGLAGTGKSTIAETVARYCAEGGNLGATFFFARDYSDRRDAVHVFPTIAHQLARLIPSFQDKLVEAVQANPDAYRAGLMEQLTRLIIEPLRDVIDAPSPLVLVFDALDECGDTTDAQGLLRLLAYATKRLASRLRIRIFITSRPEIELKTTFDSSVTKAVSHVAELHNIEDHIVQEDIRLYLHARLQAPEPIATDADVERLVQMARSLFIVASTAVKFVEDSFIRSLKGRKAQLKVLLSAEDSYRDRKKPSAPVALEPKVKGRPPYFALDAMYSLILSKALPADRDTEIEERIRSVLGTIVLLFDALSARSLEALLEREKDLVTETLERLHSVIIVPDHDLDIIPLRLIHPSFPNFLTTPTRCTDERFFVDPASQHSQLALTCLNHLIKSLERDACGIGFLPVSYESIEDLPSRVHAKVPLHLRYACFHWASHFASSALVAGGGRDAQEENPLLPAFNLFVCTKLLCWLEILSLLDRLDAAVPSLKTAEDGLMRMAQPPETTLAVIRDAQRVVMRFQDSITLSSSGIYSSALPFTPTCDLFHVYKHELNESVIVRLGQDTEWDACLRVKQMGDPVTCVAISPSGELLASALYDDTVRIWDMQTGVEVSRLDGHEGPVNSVAFSPRGDHLVSASSDKTVRVWDVQSGAEQTLLKGHKQSVDSVAFSPRGDRLASGSRDRTARIWDVQNGEECALLKGHTGSVNSVVYCVVGDRLASASEDETVRVWDARTGTEVVVFTEHGGSANSVAFSPSGDRLAVGCGDNMVRIWDMQSGREFSRLEGHSGWIFSVAFSPKGGYLASGSFDNTVRVWDVQTGAKVARLEGHSRPVNSVAFSPEGDRLASGSFDSTVRVWDVQMSETVATIKGHTDSVTCAVFSTQGDRLASGSKDRTIRVWEVLTGAKAAILVGHSKSINSVAFSPKGDCLASGSNDKTVRVWDIQKGTEVAKFEGHEARVNSVAFSPTNNHVVSGSDDYTIRVWDVQSEVEAARFNGFRWVTAVRFSPDGRHICFRDNPTIQRVWEITTTGSDAITHAPNRFRGLIEVTDSPDTRVSWHAPWVTYGDQHLCHLGTPISFWTSGAENRIALGTDHGVVLILDFTPVISQLNFKYGSASSNPRGTPHDNLRQPSLAELVTLTPSAIPAQPVKSPNKSEGWWSNALLWYTRATPPQAQVAPMILLLEDDDPKFSHIKQKFNDSWLATFKSLPEVKYIYQIIQTQAITDRYERYCDDVEDREHFLSQGKSMGNECQLWHGAKRVCSLGDDPSKTGLCQSLQCTLCCIISKNFQKDSTGLSGRSFRRFGNGIYTTPISSKSDDYIQPNPLSFLKAVLLTHVVVGRGMKLMENYPALSSPPNGYDSVLGEPGPSLNYPEVVVYDNDAVVPAWLVVYG